MIFARIRPAALIVAAIAFFLFPLVLWAQQTRVAVSGTVQDPSGGFIVGARVHLHKPRAASVATATTNAEGSSHSQQFHSAHTRSRWRLLDLRF